MDAQALSAVKVAQACPLRPRGLHGPCWSMINRQVTRTYCRAQQTQLSVMSAWAGGQFIAGWTHGNVVPLRLSPHCSSAVPQHEMKSLRTNKKKLKTRRAKATGVMDACKKRESWW